MWLRCLHQNSHPPKKSSKKVQPDPASRLIKPLDQLSGVLVEQDLHIIDV